MSLLRQRPSSSPTHLLHAPPHELSISRGAFVAASLIPQRWFRFRISLSLYTSVYLESLYCMILRLNQSTNQEFSTIYSCNRSGTNWWRWVCCKLGGCSWHLISLMFYFLFMFQVMWITGSRLGFRQTRLRWSYRVGEASLVEKSN